MTVIRFIVFLTGILVAVVASSKEKRVLFIGNSYTYYPMEANKPGLPFFVEEIAQSIDANTDVVETCHTVPNANLEFHFNTHVSRTLMEQPYDEVILQGRSTDPLKVPTWFRRKGMLGLASFRMFLPRILQIVTEKSPHVTLFVPWGYHPNHEYFRSADGEFKGVDSDEWSGQTGLEYQRLINKGYVESARGYPVSFSFVGDEWLLLVNSKVVSLDELYVKDDWSHPSPLGSMIAALVLTRDVFHLDIEKNKFVPTGLDPAKIAEIAKALKR